MVDTITAPPHRHTASAPRIAILTASCGGGHVRAAEAIHLAMDRVCPEAIVERIDVLDYTTAAFRRVYRDWYYDLAGRAPHVVGYLYDRLDRAAPPAASSTRIGRAVRDGVRRGLRRLNFGRLVDFLAPGTWDLVVNTHFLPAELIASLRAAGRVRYPQATVTTDFYVHQMWAHAPTEQYFVATDEAAASLAPRVGATSGLPAAGVSITGIPVHPLFTEDRDPARCRQSFGIATDRPAVLQLAGGFGFGRVEEVHRAILDVDRPVHVVVAAGRNPEVARRVESVPCPPRHRRTVLGFTTRIDELMAAADAIISKPGGLTTSEALARGSAMVVVDPIPGQECHNADFLLENGAAVKVNHLPSLAFKLGRLLDDPGRLASLRRAASLLARPYAAFDVAEQALRMIGVTPRPANARQQASQPQAFAQPVG